MIKENLILLNYLEKRDSLPFSTEAKEKLKAIRQIFLNLKIGPDLLFDLDKLESEKSLSNEKKHYLSNYLSRNNKLPNGMCLKLDSYLKLKDLSRKVDIFFIYDEFHLDFKENRKSIIREKLSVSAEKSICVNRNSVKHKNLFLKLKGHKLEKVYQKVFSNFDFNSEKLIESISKNGFFFPDELAWIFRKIGNNLEKLDEQNFEYMVYNTDTSWFVLFASLDNSEIYSNVLKA